jgi:MFS family permease
MSQQPTDRSQEKGLFGFNRNIVRAGFVSLFTDFSSQMTLSILPLFLTEVLDAPVWVVGLIEGLGTAVAGILRIFSGWMADRIGHRKYLMMAGYGISNLIKPLLGWTAGWGQVLSIRLVDRIGKGTRSAPRDALLADVTTSQDRGKSFGFRRAMDALGAALGPLAAALILSFTHGNLRMVFFMTIIPGVIALIILSKLKEPRKNPITVSHALPTLGFHNLQRDFKVFTMVSALIAVANFSEAFFILRARSLGLALPLIPVAYFTTGLMSSVLSVPTGIVSDRLGRKGVLAFGYIVLAVTDFGFSLVSRSAWVWPLMGLYGLFTASVEGNQKVYVSELVPPTERGSAFGTFSATVGICALPGGLLAGLLWQIGGPRLPFAVASIIVLLALAVMALFLRPHHGPRTE